MINYINANIPDKSEVTMTSHIKHIHIGVFFDGTGNNMMQQAHYETFKAKRKEWLNFGKESDPNSVIASKEQKESYNSIESKIKEIKFIESQIKLAENSGYYGVATPSQGIQELKIKRKLLYEELEKLQAEAHVDSKSIHDDKCNPYSNVAILHSALKHHENTNESLYYNIYIEGSGGGNLADTEENVIQKGINSGGGLGFGVGVKGVASLVAKACDYIYRYLVTQKLFIDENTRFHFYVFGFSRGSTCARLFAQLATRKEGCVLTCEPELVKYTKECNRKNRLAFLEKDFLTFNTSGVGVIKRTNVFVEFLGIFDTVSAIGILQQADGSVNPLRDMLKSKEITKEYVCHFKTGVDNYHYNNAREYGLFINENNQMKEVFHIGAADEYRENFAFMSIGNGINKGLEIIIPGCHSDVGGSYVEYSGNKERVLYRFVPRIGDIYKDNENADLENAERFKKSKRFSFFISEKTRKSITLFNPINTNNNISLTTEGLASAGWIDTYCADEKLKPSYLDFNCKHKCTLRFVDSKESDKRCVKFSHNARGYYSHIPLRMMLTRSIIKTADIIGDLFDNKLVEMLFPFPDNENGESDLASYGSELIELAKSDNGKRIWVTAGDDYFSESYRKLRLKYLHFTASCQLVDWKLRFKFAEIDWSNFGNECNYTEDGKICRIMYEGNNSAIESPRDGVKIFQLNPTSQVIKFEHKAITVDPLIYQK